MFGSQGNAAIGVIVKVPHPFPPSVSSGLGDLMNDISFNHWSNPDSSCHDLMLETPSETRSTILSVCMIMEGAMEILGHEMRVSTHQFTIAALGLSLVGYSCSVSKNGCRASSSLDIAVIISS